MAQANHGQQHADKAKQILDACKFTQSRLQGWPARAPDGPSGLGAWAASLLTSHARQPPALSHPSKQPHVWPLRHPTPRSALVATLRKHCSRPRAPGNRSFTASGQQRREKRSSTLSSLSNTRRASASDAIHSLPSHPTTRLQSQPSQPANQPALLPTARFLKPSALRRNFCRDKPAPAIPAGSLRYSALAIHSRGRADYSFALALYKFPGRQLGSHRLVRRNASTRQRILLGSLTVQALEAADTEKPRAREIPQQLVVGGPEQRRRKARRRKAPSLSAARR